MEVVFQNETSADAQNDKMAATTKAESFDCSLGRVARLCAAGHGCLYRMSIIACVRDTFRFFKWMRGTEVCGHRDHGGTHIGIAKDLRSDPI